MKTMGLMIKSVGALGTLLVTYVDRTLTPLFWALLLLVAVDILLNAHQEAKQFQKIGSAFAALAGTYGLAGHFGQPDFMRVAVAVSVLAYLQIVVPQLLDLVNRIKWPASAGPTKAELQAALTIATSELQKIQAQAQAQAMDSVTTQQPAQQARSNTVQDQSAVV